MESGTKLAHYEISTLLGKGGMGEVWRARDTKLGREVAIKTLPEEFSKDADRLARFEREAKLLASLNHPNIAAIYGLEQHEGTRFLVLELVEGPTLGDRIKQGAIPVKESLELALQTAEALEAAHEKGVIHRDLKPDNIKVTPDGKVKVLDFGLAKAFAGDGTDVSVSNSPTLSMAATEAGIILGTAAYMSPEQASGEATDKRADIWSFGVVLFEMLTGRQVFTGKNVSRILAAVLNSEPEWNSLPANLHPRVRMLLERSLEKEAKDRVSGISDARVEVQKVLADPDGVLLQQSADRGGRRAFFSWVVGSVLVTAILAGLAGWMLRPAPEPDLVTRFSYELLETQELQVPSTSLVAFSPDGSQFVYNTVEGLYVRSANEFDARLILGADVNVRNPVFSPNGEWLVYYTGIGDELKKIAVSGGAPVVLCDASVPFGMSWSNDDTIVFGQPEGIMVVSANGGTPQLIVSAQEEEQVDSPQLLPGGEWVLFSLATTDGFNRWEEAQIIVQSLESGERKIVLEGGGDARYVPTGHLVYVLGDDLFAIPFDLETLEVAGGPVPIVQGVARASARATQTGTGHFSFSEQGSLVYLQSAVSTSSNGVLALVDWNGVVEQLNVPEGQYRSPRLSPDGRQLAAEIIGDEGQSDIWIYDLSMESEIRVLTQEGNNTRPVWTPNSQSVTFASDRDGDWGLYSRRADGSTLAERLTTAENGAVHYPESWSRDGNTLTFAAITDEWSLWKFSVDSGVSEVFYDVPSSNEFCSSFSPDGNWVAYTSTFEFGIYIQPFPATGVIHQITQNGEACPVWAADGSELLYRRQLNTGLGPQLLAMEISTDGALTFGGQRTLPMQGSMMFQNYRDYDILPDGEQFVMIFPPDQTALADPTRPQINIVLNWFEELKQRVPIP